LPGTRSDNDGIAIDQKISVGFRHADESQEKAERTTAMVEAELSFRMDPAQIIAPCSEPVA
jgi:hypothetical protein